MRVGPSLHIGRCVRAERADALAVRPHRSEHAIHQDCSETLALMRGVGFDVGHRDHAVDDRVVGETDALAGEQQLEPRCCGHVDDGQIWPGLPGCG